MTEDEAKESACCGPHPCGKITYGYDPEAPDYPRRGSGALSDAITMARNRQVPVKRTCVGSACMGWRSRPITGDLWNDSDPDNPPEGAIWFWSAERGKWWRATTIVDGYCGLAGAP